MVSDELVRRLQTGVGKLHEEGLQAVLLGGPVPHIAGTVPLQQDDEIGYVFAGNERLWSVVSTGPGRMSTVVCITDDLDIAVQSLIEFSRLERRTETPLRLIQKMIWDIQRAGFWCVVSVDGFIKVSTVEAEPMEWPDDFMELACSREKKYPMATIDFTDDHWTIVVTFDQSQHSSKRLQSSGVETIARMVIDELTRGKA
ncbi:MAG: hypothetical protein JNL42_08075 [Anaerolineae bacterium]|nr:hypothetical protein [Anaerolineae bacterium]